MPWEVFPRFLPINFQIESTKSHVCGPLGGRDMAISVLGRTSLSLALARWHPARSLAPSLARSSSAPSLARLPLARSPARPSFAPRSLAPRSPLARASLAFRSALALFLYLSNLSHFGFTFVELQSYCTYICRT